MLNSWQVYSFKMSVLSTAPDQPPQNITAVSPTSTSLTLQWKAVHEFHVNGILRGYRVFCYKASNTTAKEYELDTAGKRRGRRDMTSLVTFELTDLQKFTNYTIKILAYTVADGVPGMINITTAEDGRWETFIYTNCYCIYIDILCMVTQNSRCSVPPIPLALLILSSANTPSPSPSSSSLSSSSSSSPSSSSSS